MRIGIFGPGSFSFGSKRRKLENNRVIIQNACYTIFGEKKDIIRIKESLERLRDSCQFFEDNFKGDDDKKKKKVEKCIKDWNLKYDLQTVVDLMTETPIKLFIHKVNGMNNMQDYEEYFRNGEGSNIEVKKVKELRNAVVNSNVQEPTGEESAVSNSDLDHQELVPTAEPLNEREKHYLSLLVDLLKRVKYYNDNLLGDSAEESIKEKYLTEIGNIYTTYRTNFNTLGEVESMCERIVNHEYLNDDKWELSKQDLRYINSQIYVHISKNETTHNDKFEEFVSNVEAITNRGKNPVLNMLKDLNYEVNNN